ncbi:MAG: NADPH:quinone reductase [Rhodospirillales bacterium]|nr:NADPH:quinone reductase [Rhodospirillales bacterium]
MKAAWYSQNGAAREVLVVGDLPTPEPAAGEVRVRLHSSGANPSDVKSRRNRPVTAERIVPHSDGAGIIDKVGAGVPSSRVGERVWIWNGQWQRPMGTAAEFIALPSEQAVLLPENTDFAAAACLGIPALTAFQAVHLLGEIAGKTILVIGASSAVGHFTTQIATRQAGARVIGTVGSAEKAAHARKAGAEATIDYKTENVAERVKSLTGRRGADAIIDMDLSTTATLLEHDVLAPHGTLVCYGSNVGGNVPVFFPKLLTRSHDLRFFLVYDLTKEDRRSALSGIGEMLLAGTLDHVIGARFGLDDIAAAHEAVEGGRLIGNVVVTMP